MPKKCLNNSSTFCYVCGWLTFKSPRRNFIPLFKKCCELSFGCKVGDEDKRWALQISCVTCVRLLTGWVNISRQMPFAVSIVWRKPKGHSSDWYFNKHNRDHLQIQIHSEISRFSIYNEACPKLWRFSCTKRLWKSDFQWWKLWFCEDLGQQKRVYVDWLHSVIWRMLFLIWTPFINTRIP